MSENSAIGHSSAIGYNAIGYNAIGYNANAIITSNPGNENFAIGYSANAIITSNPGNENFAIGHSATLVLPSGSYKTAVGYSALSLYNEQYGTIFDNITIAPNQNARLHKHTDHIWTISGWLDDRTCDALIKNMNTWMEKRDMHTFGTGSYRFYNDLQETPAVASDFYNGIARYIPDRYKSASGGLWQVVRANTTIPWAAYKAGEEFGAHKDTSVIHHDGRDLMTCLIYLNDDYSGGETVFYADAECSNEITRIKPEKGKILLFDIDLYHRGEKVTQGKKYWVGFELIFAEEHQKYF